MPPALLTTRATVDLTGLRPAGAVMLGAAAVLSAAPGDQGIPCPLRALTGIPCPLCGMTTSVTEAVRLDLADAWAANPVGIAAVVVAIVLLVLKRPTELPVPWWLVGSALGGMWLFQLHRFAVI